ncbi:hypothetical protein FKP32DRAFT_1192190 [Trametes sanguinea]|nr:hypothetical protein FKP32DRAFT_1192190 [Trametes sanguinea]
MHSSLGPRQVLLKARRSTLSFRSHALSVLVLVISLAPCTLHSVGPVARRVLLLTLATTRSSLVALGSLLAR